MIVTSRPMQATAVMLAAGLHIVAFQGVDFSEKVQIAEAGATQEVALGNAFADLASGVLTAEPVEKITEPVTSLEETKPSETTSVDPTTAAAQPPPVSVSDVPAVTPTTQPNADLTRPDQNAVVAAEVTQAVPVTPITPTTVTVLAPTAASTGVSTRTPTLRATPHTTTSVQPVAPDDAAPAPQAEALTGEDVSITAPLQSRRPTVRPDWLAPPRPPRQAQPRQQTRQPRGNAEQNAQAGAQTSAQRQTTATSSGSKANAVQSAAVSNAAISNYPGQVMRRVSRVRRPRANARGAAVVAFSIAGSGGLGSLSISRSSGNAELDTMALEVVQRAAPFPPPPAGAQTRFRIEITGR